MVPAVTRLVALNGLAQFRDLSVDTTRPNGHTDLWRRTASRHTNHLPRFSPRLKHRMNSVSRWTVVDGFPRGAPSSTLRFTDKEALSTATE